MLARDIPPRGGRKPDALWEYVDRCRRGNPKSGYFYEITIYVFLFLIKDKFSPKI